MSETVHCWEVPAADGSTLFRGLWRPYNESVAQQTKIVFWDVKTDD